MSQQEKWAKLRRYTESLPDRRSGAGIRADVLLELLDDLDAAAEALVQLRLLCGAAGRLDDAEACLTSLGFAYPFTGYRNSAATRPEGTNR